MWVWAVGVVLVWVCLPVTTLSSATIIASGEAAVGSWTGSSAESGKWQSLAQVGATMNNPLRFKFPRAPHLRVAAESWPPHVEVLLKDVSGPGVLQETFLTVIHGPMADFLSALAASLNFTYTIVQGDGYWGAPSDNGTWNGMIGMLLEQRADLGLGPFGLTYQRSQVVDFTFPIFSEVLHILVTRPGPLSDPWGFLDPFTWQVWVCVGVSMVMVAVVETGMEGMLPNQTPSFTTHLWIAYEMLISSSAKPVAQSVALRVTVCLWLMAVLVLTRSYSFSSSILCFPFILLSRLLLGGCGWMLSGGLTSLLAVKTVPLKYDSLNDVLDDPQITLLMEGSTALTGYLQSAEGGVYGELGRAVRVRGVQVKASQLQELAYTLLADGRHAIFLEESGCDKVYSDGFTRTGRCDFYMSRGVFWPLLYALVVPQASPLRALINARIIALREFGVYEVWARSQTPNMTHCLRMPTKIKFQEAYTIFHLWVVFIVLAGGMVLAFLVFLCEFALARLTYLTS